jgi:membrane protein DedA with SNARE-associated domain
MDWFAGIITEHEGLALFLASLVGNLGLPVPAFPVLMLAGALSLGGRINFPEAVGGAAAGAATANILWYHLGRWQGRGVLFMLCRMALNPDACMEQAIYRFHRYPTAMVLFAKFLPGASTIVPPVAGMVSMPLYRFASLSLIGALLWAAAGVGLGFAFGIEIVHHGGRIYNALGWILAGGVAVFLTWRTAYRYYLVRRFSAPRLSPKDLHEKMVKGEEILVLDLRIDRAFEGSAEMVRGARRVRPATFHKRVHELPADRDLVFYCT